MDRSTEVCVAISPTKLARLLSEQRLSAEDFRCLTPKAKRLVRALVLDILRKAPSLDHRLRDACKAEVPSNQTERLCRTRVGRAKCR